MVRSAAATAEYRPTEDEPFMNPRQRDYFRRKLENWKEDILRESRETLENLQEESQNHPDMADRASSESDRALELRTRDRQRTCGDSSCRTELHKRSCARWRRDNDHLLREGRVLDRVVAADARPSDPPVLQLDWPAIELLVGLATTALLRQVLLLALRGPRDEMPVQPVDSSALSSRLPTSARRDEIPAQPTENTALSGGLPALASRDEITRPAQPP